MELNFRGSAPVGCLASRYRDGLLLAGHLVISPLPTPLQGGTQANATNIKGSNQSRSVEVRSGGSGHDRLSPGPSIPGHRKSLRGQLRRSAASCQGLWPEAQDWAEAGKAGVLWQLTMSLSLWKWTGFPRSSGRCCSLSRTSRTTRPGCAIPATKKLLELPTPAGTRLL